MFKIDTMIIVLIMGLGTFLLLPMVLPVIIGTVVFEACKFMSPRNKEL